MRIADSGCDQKGEWSGYVSAVQETERRRIASELHDGLGQMLTVLTMELRSAKIVALSCNPLVPALGLALERAYASARQAIDELRRSVMNLYPSMLDDLGIVASLSAVLREAREADPRLRIDADITVSDAQVPAALRIVAFRVVQEAVNNVLKHAEAQLLNLSFSYKNDFLTLSIVDDGQGIAPKILQEQRICSGISGMVRRVEASGGEIEVSSVVGSGTRIAVVWNTVMLRQ
jgi:two-component system NarL family sensor kinase